MPSESTTGTTAHLSASPVVSAPSAAIAAAAISTAAAITSPWASGWGSAVPACVPSSIAPVAATAIAAHPASAASAHTAAHTTSHHHVIFWLNGNLLNFDLLTVNSNCSLLEQSICRLLFVKGDETEVLGLAILTPIDRPLNFNNLTILSEMLSDSVLGDVGVLEFAHVNLALFRSGLFDGNLLALNGVILGQDSLESVYILENDKGETSGTASHLIHL